MKLILEGPDNSGKTTLADDICVKAGAMYFHPGGAPDGHEAEEACVKEQVGLLLRNERVVLDRCTPISQRVYNADPVQDIVRKVWLDQYLLTGALVIYCRPSTDRLLMIENFTWREGESEEHKQKIITRCHEFIERYDDIMQRIPHVSYDHAGPFAGATRNMVAAALGGDREAEHLLRNMASNRLWSK